jgi:ferredoxin
VIALPAAVLSLIVVLSALRGRLYCNTVCPVGTLLGFFSRWAAFRVTIEKSSCQKCGECLRACKAQCIDLRNGSIDHSRCVACYNCFGACDNHSIGYRFAWKRNTRAEAVAIAPSIESVKQTAASLATDSQRRTFIASATVAVVASLGGAKLFGANETRGPGSTADHKDKLNRPVCPPGSVSIDRFLDRCTACQLCVSACPTNVLQPAFREYGLSSLLKPRLDFNRGACDFDCRRCGEVCPSGAIGLLDLAEKQITRIGVVHFEATRCLVQASGKACTACSDKCPTKAIQTVAFSAGLRLPTTQPLLCIGCGNCEHACPTAPVKAITVIGRRWHNHAKKAAEGPGIPPMVAPPQNISSSGSTLPGREPVIMSVS